MTESHEPVGHTTQAEEAKIAAIQEEQRQSLQREAERTKLGIWIALAIIVGVIGYLILVGRPTGSDLHVIRIAVPLDAQTLDPHAATDIESGRLCQLLYDGLVAFPHGEDAFLKDPVPALAERWELSDDRLAYTFYLRDGVIFHDGATLDAEAVKMALDRARGVDNTYFGPMLTAPQYAPLYRDIVEVEAVDRLTVRIAVREPNVTLLRNLAMTTAAIPSPKWLRALAAGDEPPVAGTGPLKLRDWKREQVVTLERHEEYWGASRFGTMKADRVLFQVVKEAQQRLNHLKAGKVDIAVDIRPEHAGELEAAADLRLIRVNVPNVCYLVMNPNPQIPTIGDATVMRDNPLAPAWLREAIALALDKEQIVDVVYRGYAIPAKSMLSPLIAGHPHHWPEPESLAVRRERARTLLASHGHGPDNPVRISLNLFTEPRAYLPYTLALGEQVKIQLAEVGINVELHPEPWDQYLARSKTGAYPFLVIGWQTVSGDADYTFSPLFAVAENGRPADLNMPKWVDTEFLGLVDRARGEFDPERREALYHEIEARVRDARVTVPVAHFTPIWGLSENVRNFGVSPVGRLLLTNTTVAAPTVDEETETPGATERRQDETQEIRGGDGE